MSEAKAKAKKFSTAFESINSEHQTAKEAGLSKQDAIEYESQECATMLHAILLKEELSEEDRYKTIHKHIGLLSSALATVHAMYA